MSKFDLYPLPTLQGTGDKSMLPAVWPGVNPKTSATLVNILKEVHERWHCFFNRETGYHNHTSHHAIALWALGATEEAMRQAYTRDLAYQLPMVQPPGKITESNWKQHLGDDNYYKAYLDFFTQVVEQRGSAAAVEDYIFSLDANFSEDGSSIAMFSRFLAAVYHPIIFVGYGLELGIPGMVVQGLAQAAIHKDDSGVVLTPAFFKRCFNDIKTEPTPTNGTTSTNGSLSSTRARLDKLIHEQDATTSTAFAGLKLDKGPDVHALSIIARVLKDPQFNKTGAVKLLPRVYSDCVKKFSGPIREYACQWTMNMKQGDREQNQRELSDKFEELAWAYTLIYGLTGWSKGKVLKADFLLAHIVTSGFYLPYIANKLKASSQVLLLRGHLAVTLAWWIGLGRPKFDVTAFAEADELPTTATNPWLPIIQSAVVHDEDHVPKLQRTLSQWSQLYGMKGPNDPKLSATELPGADKLDGRLFTRIAKLTAERADQPRPPGSEKELAAFHVWDRATFAEDEH
ncbi:hypothetical protein AMATHDRAFT_198053 [Amanita thiersii Skay4041]|uniref:Uncharacterized protein n=1 Tax=Amanita thiersii Skay4041 TaxID=703135 RepID=A0A2A9NGQ9_9AGAR|nr:hypothetical protein AMATHDRAFT_198053 [Amanita thiersii Skay4041]